MSVSWWNLLHVPMVAWAVLLPSFDYTTLRKDSGMLHQALTQHGMLTLRHVPQYAETRRMYLMEAARCARTESRSHRKLNDGTDRYTIVSSKPPACSATFMTLQKTLNTMIHNTVLSCGKALQMIDRKVSNIIETAETLDHFHLYVKPKTIISTTSKSPAIDFHTDNGLLVAFTAPMLLTQEFIPIELSDDSESGLFIKDSMTKQIVQPHLPPDELILMLGEGLSQWTGLKSLLPVVHGMTMPKIDEMKQRAWFGKMFLLPDHVVMDNTQMTFGSYKNATKRFVMDDDQGISDHRMALACPVNRRLEASDDECKRKICQANVGSGATTASCNTWCNDEMDDAQAECNEKCYCDTQNFLRGEMCWMLCLENIKCQEHAAQECNEITRQLECIHAELPSVQAGTPVENSNDRLKTFVSSTLWILILLPIYLYQMAY